MAVGNHKELRKQGIMETIKYITRQEFEEFMENERGNFVKFSEYVKLEKIIPGEVGKLGNERIVIKE